MKRLAILLISHLLSFSAHAVSDMIADMQKTYSKFTNLDIIKYEARGTIQPVWFRYSDNAEETMISGKSEHMRLQIMGTAVKEDTSATSGKALVPTNSVLNVIDGAMYCDEIAKVGCPIHIRVGGSESFTTYGKFDNDATGKMLILDNTATIRLLKDIQKTAKSDTENKYIYIEAPFLVVGNKQFKFGLLDTPLQVD